MQGRGCYENNRVVRNYMVTVGVGRGGVGIINKVQIFLSLRKSAIRVDINVNNQYSIHI